MLKGAAILSLLLVVSGALSYRLGILPFGLAFYGFGLGLLASALLSMAAAAMTFRGLARRQPVGGLLAVMLAGVTPVLVVIYTVGVAGFQAPPIHDISTDVVDPPVFIFAQSQRQPDDNSLDYGGEKLAAQQRQAYPDIRPLQLAVSQERAWSAALAVIDQLGWQLLGEDAAQGQIEAVDRTPIMGFADDFVVRIKPQGEGVQIDLRSVSRVGVSDLGANAKRIRVFIEQLRYQLALPLEK